MKKLSLFTHRSSLIAIVSYVLALFLFVSCGSATPIEKYKKRSEQSYLMDLQEEKNQQILQNENM